MYQQSETGGDSSRSSPPRTEEGWGNRSGRSPCSGSKSGSGGSACLHKAFNGIDGLCSQWLTDFELETQEGAEQEPRPRLSREPMSKPAGTEWQPCPPVPGQFLAQRLEWPGPFCSMSLLRTLLRRRVEGGCWCLMGEAKGNERWRWGQNNGEAGAFLFFCSAENSQSRVRNCLTGQSEGRGRQKREARDASVFASPARTGVEAAGRRRGARGGVCL